MLKIWFRGVMVLSAFMLVIVIFSKGMEYAPTLMWGIIVTGIFYGVPYFIGEMLSDDDEGDDE